MKRAIRYDDLRLLKIAPIIQERIVTLDEAVEMAGFFFTDEIKPNPNELIGKGLDKVASAKIAKDVLEIIKKLPDVTHEKTEVLLRNYVEKTGLSAGQVFGIMRVAITGQKVSPPLFESMEIIGKDQVVSRLEDAYKLLS